MQAHLGGEGGSNGERHLIIVSRGLAHKSRG